MSLVATAGLAGSAAAVALALYGMANLGRTPWLPLTFDQLVIRSISLLKSRKNFFFTKYTDRDGSCLQHLLRPQRLDPQRDIHLEEEPIVPMVLQFYFPT